MTAVPGQSSDTLVEQLDRKLASKGAWMTSDLRDFYAALKGRITTLEAENARLREALKSCRELFREIRMDWSDPRAECREGMAIIDKASEINREQAG